jgi:hypothetical protein
LNPVIKQWISQEVLHKYIKKEIELNFLHLKDYKRAEAFKSFIPIKDASVEDYLPKLIEFNTKEFVIFGIRFRKGLKSEPFVELYAYNVNLEEKDNLNRLVNLVADTFSKFKPKWLRVNDTNCGLYQKFNTEIKCEIDNYIFASPLINIRNISLITNDSNYNLETPKSIYFYERYLEAYESCLDENPFLRGIIFPETKETLQEHLKKKTLKIVTHKGNWQGVIAARHSCFYGATSFLIVENCLAKEIRQMNKSSALLKEFVSGLSNNDEAIIYGTISPLNIPSIKTAKRIGRQKIMESILFQLG